MTLLLTIGAMVLAVFFGAIAWRLAREEQSRSAARVAALGAAIDEHTAATPGQTVDVPPAFLATDRPVSSRSGALKIAAGFGVAVVLIVTLATMGVSGDRRPENSTEPAAEAAATSQGSLELLSMRHERSGDVLTVTGLVRNGGSVRAERLIAVVFTFDRNGDFVASGRAPLEFLSLAPTDESPFRVSIPNAGEVGRYRVSFRNDTGVMRHVDRRQALAALGTE